MSGIVGLAQLDGAPIDSALLESLTVSLAFRGPDAQGTWRDGHVALGHTMLRTTFEAERETQPCTLDGRVWITADARVDARDDLMRKLEGRGRHEVRVATDPELILHAYHVWGEQCVEHLLGDFAFAIWDGRMRRLFCARDHFGVKPFYYALKGNVFIFSNTLNTIRAHPVISDALNELAIADFLLFDMNQEPDTTTFADIARLPPGHVLSVDTGAQLTTRRYWLLPIEEPIQYRRPQDYVDHFRSLLTTCVRDRLRTRSVGVWMSGGLDSPLLAAEAVAQLRASAEPFDLRAYTVVYDHLIPDQERHYAGLVATHLGISIEYVAADDDRMMQADEFDRAATPEPMHNPTGAALLRRQYRLIAGSHRVAFYGEGPDNALHYDWKPYMRHMGQRRQYGRLTGQLLESFRSSPRLPMVRGMLGRTRKAAGRQDRCSFPRWLNQDFCNRLNLRDRWQGRATASASGTHGVRPVAYRSLTGPPWDSLFSGFDAAYIQVPLEVRHPHMDVRMVRYLLALPPIPWCRNKWLLRKGGLGLLPEAIRRRSKAALARNPAFEFARRRGVPIVDLAPRIEKYVRPQAVGSATDGVTQLWIDLRPRSLSYWFELSADRPTDIRQPQEART